MICGYLDTTPADPTALLGAWAIWSLKRYVSGYSGPAIRVRRSSDNAETDIDLAGTAFGNSLDTAALAAFVGTDSAYVTTRYDQTGQSHHDAQTTAAYQPRIVNAGTYDGKIVFDGTDDRFTSVVAGGTPLGMTAVFTGNVRALPPFSAQTLCIYGIGEAGIAWEANTNPFGANGLTRLYVTQGGNYHTDGFGPQISNNVHSMVMDRTLPAADMIQLYVNGMLTAKTGSLDIGTVSPGSTFASGLWTTGSKVDGTDAGTWDIITQVIFESAKDATQNVAIYAVIA